MASSINASTSGAGGVITTADNTGILNLQTGGTTAVTVDASQNVGIGVTPSAWSAGKSFEVGGVGNTVWGQTGDMSIGQGFYYSAGYKYALTGSAPNFLEMYNGAFIFRTAASGTAGNAITWTQAMTLDSSGNLLVGYSTLPTYSGKLNVNGNISWGDQSGKGRIYSDVNWGCILQASKASPGASAFLFTNASDTNLVQFNGALGTGTVYSSGGVLTNTNPSDATLKTNVQDLSLGLDFINQLRPVTFDWINDRADQKTQYGFIAQEVQTIEPSIIREFEHIESDDPENIEKSIKLGIEEKAIYTAMVKAIQEQQTIINDLKARIETLEAK